MCRKNSLIPVLAGMANDFTGWKLGVPGADRFFYNGIVVCGNKGKVSK
jgi:hypothetical protein